MRLDVEYALPHLVSTQRMEVLQSARRILVRLRLTPLTHSPKLVNHLLETLPVSHAGSGVESVVCDNAALLRGAPVVLI